MHAKRDHEGACRVCGRAPVDAAHIIPRSLAPNGGEIADNCVPLCREHHVRYDQHRLDLEPFLTSAELAQAVWLMGSLAGAARVVNGHADD